MVWQVRGIFGLVMIVDIDDVIGEDTQFMSAKLDDASGSREFMLWVLCTCTFVRLVHQMHMALRARHRAMYCPIITLRPFSGKVSNRNTIVHFDSCTLEGFSR